MVFSPRAPRSGHGWRHDSAQWVSPSLALGSVQSRADVASEGNDGRHCFGVLVAVITDSRMGSCGCPIHGSTEESFRTGPVLLVPQPHVDGVLVLIHCTIEI